VGDVLRDLPLTVAIGIGGLVLVVIGSIGPWATLLALSVSGTRGDGKITLVVAVVAVALALIGRPSTMLIATLGSVGSGVIAAVDLTHIHRVVADVTLFGNHVVSAGWGIYMVVVGALLAVLALGYQCLFGTSPSEDADSTSVT
jgi:hypothetical protein